LELEDEGLERLGFLEDLRERRFRVRERVNFGRERERAFSGEITTGGREFAQKLRSR